MGGAVTCLSVPVVLTTSTGLLQVLAPPDMTARVLAVSMMVTFGVLPFGYLLVGYTGKVLGAPGAIVLNAALLIAAGAGLLLLHPELRRWMPEAHVMQAVPADECQG